MVSAPPNTPPPRSSSGTWPAVGRDGVNIPAVLSTLRDVAGIAGSFVFTDRGQLFGREIHPMFDDTALGEAAERLTRMHDTFAAAGDHLDMATIRFQEHRLYLKTFEGGMLCALADGEVNVAALRMAANLVCRRIAGELHASGGALAMLSPPVSSATSATPAPLASSSSTSPGRSGDGFSRRSSQEFAAVPSEAAGHASSAVSVPGGTSPSATQPLPAGTRRFRGRPVD